MNFIPAGGQRFAIIGIVGGIGSGKSTLTRWVCERIPLQAIFADELGHQVLRFPAVIEQLRDLFGDAVIDPQGGIVRQQLGARIWGNSDAAIAARQQLEGVVHPEIRQLILKQIEEARRVGFCWGVLLDAAVMMESGLSALCDRIVFVATEAEVRRQRVIQRGWTAEHWQERERSQLSLEEKQSRCHFTVDNSGPVEQAGEKLLIYLRLEFGWVEEPD